MNLLTDPATLDLITTLSATLVVVGCGLGAIFVLPWGGLAAEPERGGRSGPGHARREPRALPQLDVAVPACARVLGS